jgi:hypothetical protein
MVLVKKGGVQADKGSAMDPSEHKHDHKDAPQTPSDEKKEQKPEGQATPSPELKDLFPKADAPKDATKAKYLCSMDGGTRETPGPCPKCKMALTEEDRVKAAGSKAEEKKTVEAPKTPAAPAKEEPRVQEEKKPDPPKAEAMKPQAQPDTAKPEAQTKPDEKAPKEFVYKCPMDGAVRDTPGPCPKCKMPLGELHKVPKETPQKERTIYVCDVHPESVSDKPGQCFKESCAGMELEPRKIVPGAKLIYVCPVHPEVKSGQPGICTKEKCGKKLGFKVISEATQLAEAWACPLHPQMTAGGKLKCPECGRDMKHMEVEQVLAVPISAVIDTGERKVVFVDMGHGTFDAMVVEVGLRAGEYYPVIKGLAAGDRVVTAGAFLLDAETRLNPAAGVIYFGASGQETKK